MPWAWVLDSENKMQRVEFDAGQLAYFLERGIEVFGDDTDPEFTRLNAEIVKEQQILRTLAGKVELPLSERAEAIEAIAEAANHQR